MQKPVKIHEESDWRASATQALAGAEGEMTKVAVGGLIAAAAALEGSAYSENAARSVAEALDACATIAAKAEAVDALNARYEPLPLRSAPGQPFEWDEGYARVSDETLPN